MDIRMDKHGCLEISTDEGRHLFYFRDKTTDVLKLYEELRDYLECYTNADISCL